MYLLKIYYDEFTHSHKEICYNSEKECLEKFIEQINLYINFKRYKIILPGWKINQDEIDKLQQDIRVGLNKIDNAKQLNLPSLKEFILENEIIVGQSKNMVKKLIDEQRDYIKEKQKEISENSFPDYVIKFYDKEIKQNGLRTPRFEIVEVNSFENRFD